MLKEIRESIIAKLDDGVNSLPTLIKQVEKEYPSSLVREMYWQLHHEGIIYSDSSGGVYLLMT